MRIGFDISTRAFNSAGNARYSLRLLESLRQATAATTDTIIPLQLPDRLHSARAGSKRKIVSVFWELIYAPYLTQILGRRFKCDLIHFTAPTPILQQRALNQHSRVVTTILDVIPVIHPEWFPHIMGTRLRRWITRAARHSDHLLTISQSTTRDLQRILPRLQTPITEAYLGPLLDSSTGHVAPTDLPSKRYILSVGTLEPRKNLGTVLDAYNLIKQEQPDLPTLVVVGASGWMMHDIQQQTKALGMDSDVVIAGFVDDAHLVDLYKNATMLVYPSLYEGFGLPVLEAMNLGCPVITSNRSSLPEVASDAAILIDPANPHQLAQAMQLLLNEPALQTAMRNKGRIQASSFSWQTCAQQTLEAYRHVVSV